MRETGESVGVVLQSAARDDVTLARAIEDAAPGDGVALLATPRHYHVARIRDGLPRSCEGTPVPLDDVFEARIFDGTAELRWLHTADGHGRAVLLTEDATALPKAFDERLEPVEALETLSGAYLLWGRAADICDGWTTLATPRIGTFTVPVRAETGTRVRLVTREYIACDPEHGNAYVAEERLLRLEPTPTPTNAEDTAS
jgi:CRISPR-associated protein (TIGR03984 family)